MVEELGVREVPAPAAKRAARVPSHLENGALTGRSGDQQAHLSTLFARVVSAHLSLARRRGAVPRDTSLDCGRVIRYLADAGLQRRPKALVAITGLPHGEGAGQR